MADIHSSAVIHDGAQIASSASVGPFCVVGPNVQIGENTVLQSHVSISGATKIGKDCEIFPGAILGGRPQILGATDEANETVIGDGTIIRENVTINGSSPGKAEPTRLGKNCFIMVNAHIGHDAQIGDNCVFAANVMVGGHARIANQVWMGGASGVHQNSWVGEHVFIAAGCILTGDVIPFVVAEGTSCSFNTLNAIGLTRRGFKRSDLKDIRTVIQAVFAPTDDELLFQDRVAKAREMFSDNRYATQILDFVEHPRNGRKLCPYKR
ncbi:MAG: acyl-[acyl-carrier-protein]--UDP-N-acetylglucosamine O-acyltransferase [Ponticaulis sp.]|nr:acyl-[acyl-carrier-protein]--UDP-N-acetylglucosamine O-acyltransferase [Ponticaulis sp.]|tara:strand:- start:47049 stop:47849 length:801 start_codon:yes stop_codon:yes gene_type:complete